MNYKNHYTNLPRILINTLEDNHTHLVSELPKLS